MKNILSVEKIEKYYGNKGNITKAIDNISFKVGEGEFVGIMGPSGSGKTTLLNCISTIDKVTTGNIIINDQDITRLKSKKLDKFRQNELGFIFQDFNLLDTLTIHENIALALTIQKVNAHEINRRVKEVAQKLNITEILNKYPYQISGGQKQRLAIARAIAKKPEVSIFDDSFSALDFKTDAKLRKALKSETKDATVLIVAQRISTIMNADQILVLDEGKVVGKGTHKELMENCEVYRQIALSQLSKEELQDE